MGRRFVDALLAVAVVAAIAAFVAVRVDDSACHARRFVARATLGKIAAAENGVFAEHKKYDELPLCTPGASVGCAGKLIVVELANAAAGVGRARPARSPGPVFISPVPVTRPPSPLAPSSAAGSKPNVPNAADAAGAHNGDAKLTTKAPAPPAPASATPASTTPASTAPASTAPGSTGPASTGPASTAPATTTQAATTSRTTAAVGPIDPYSFYARTTPAGFVAVAVGTSGATLGDVLTLDQAGGAWAAPGVCGWW